MKLLNKEEAELLLLGGSFLAGSLVPLEAGGLPHPPIIVGSNLALSLAPLFYCSSRLGAENISPVLKIDPEEPAPEKREVFPWDRFLSPYLALTSSLTKILDFSFVLLSVKGSTFFSYNFSWSFSFSSCNFYNGNTGGNMFEV